MVLVVPIGMKAFGLEFSNEALLKRPEHAAAIGRIMGLFSLIEAAVASILGHLMHDNHRAAVALMDSFRSNQARLAADKRTLVRILPCPPVSCPSNSRLHQPRNSARPVHRC